MVELGVLGKLLLDVLSMACPFVQVVLHSSRGSRRILWLYGIGAGIPEVCGVEGATAPCKQGQQSPREGAAEP